MLPWKACLAATPASSINKRSMYRQIYAGRTCISGNRQCCLAGYRRELESSLNPQKQQSRSLGTVLTRQGHGSERRKQLNKEGAVEGFLWVWSRRAVTTWQPAGCTQHNAGSAGLAACSRPLWPQDRRDSPFPVQSLMAQNHLRPSKMFPLSNTAFWKDRHPANAFTSHAPEHPINEQAAAA